VGCGVVSGERRQLPFAAATEPSSLAPAVPTRPESVGGSRYVRRSRFGSRAMSMAVRWMRGCTVM
jgi:hypothetical protein